MARTCYAALLGNCAGPLSLEHPYSKSIFRGGSNVVARGVPKLPEGKQLGLNSLGSRVLCKRHNELLNELDDEIGLLANAMRELIEGQRTESITVNGSKIERWFLKMAAGSAAAGWAGGGAPPEGIVQQIFGLEPVRTITLFTANGMSRHDNFPRGIENYRVSSSETILCVVNSLPLLFCGGSEPDHQTVLALARLGEFQTDGLSFHRHPRRVTMLRSDSAAHLTVNFTWS